jgi:hypothetical protein
VNFAGGWQTLHSPICHSARWSAMVSICLWVLMGYIF